MEEESKDNDWTAFITLTYDDKSLPFSSSGLPTLDKVSLSKFNKEVKRLLSDVCTVRYYCVGEYGDKSDRPHYHGIYFFKFKTYEKNFFSIIDYISETFDKSWNFGNVEVLPSDFGKLYYTAKYTIKGNRETFVGRAEPFSLSSKLPAIGSRYVSENGDFHRRVEQCESANGRFTEERKHARTVVSSCGSLLPMPRYYVRKIFGEELISFEDFQQYILVSGKQQKQAFREGFMLYKKKFPTATKKEFFDYIWKMRDETEQRIKRLKDKRNED